MSADFPESDWRRFKETHARLLEMYCSRTLSDVAALAAGTEGSAHERYLKLYKLIERRDDDIAKAFNDFRRSTALMQLVVMRNMRLLTDEELSQFSERTRSTIEAITTI